MIFGISDFRISEFQDFLKPETLNLGQTQQQLKPENRNYEKQLRPEIRNPENQRFRDSLRRK